MSVCVCKCEGVCGRANGIRQSFESLQGRASMVRRASVRRSLERGDLHWASSAWHFPACSLREPRKHAQSLSQTTENSSRNPKPNAPFEGQLRDSSHGLRPVNVGKSNDTDGAESPDANRAAGSPVCKTGEVSSERSTT